jgi:tetratricopeptide (TPR) repeat protein
LASCLRALDRANEALPLYDEALAIWDQTLGRENLRMARGLSNVAGLLVLLGDIGTAEQRYRESAAVFEAYFAREERARTAAEASLSEASVSEAGVGETGLDEPLPQTEMTFVLSDLADLLREQGRIDEALPLYRRAFELRLRDLGPEDDLTVKARNALHDAERSQP